MQKRESLGSGAVSYLRLALVPPAQATDAGGDRLRFASPAFVVPGGEVGLTLRRIRLDMGSRYPLPTAPGETLLLVEQGAGALESAATRQALETVVGSDTAYGLASVAGPATVTGQRVGTSVLAAGFG